MVRSALALPLAVLLGLALSGCMGGSGDADADWPGRDLEGADPAWRDTDLAPGTALEMDFPLRSGDSLPYDWFTMERQELRFQIHYHTASGADVTAEERTAYEGTGPFVAETSAMYSLLWMNLGDEPVELWIQVEGEQCYSDGNGGSRCGTVVQI